MNPHCTTNPLHPPTHSPPHRQDLQRLKQLIRRVFCLRRCSRAACVSDREAAVVSSLFYQIVHILWLTCLLQFESWISVIRQANMHSYAHCLSVPLWHPASTPVVSDNISLNSHHVEWDAMFPPAEPKYFAGTLLSVDDRVMGVIVVELSSQLTALQMHHDTWTETFSNSFGLCHRHLSVH